MRVRRLILSDFRCYERVEVELTPGVSIFLGANGQGKTNLIEALGYLASGTSHRVATDPPLVRAGAERALLGALVVRDERELAVEVEINPKGANRGRLGRSTPGRARDVFGALRTVLFAPEDLSLVKGDPEGRRRFLDELLTARAPRLAAVRSDYERILRQRNTLLRSAAGARRATASGELSTLDSWDAHLARTGAELVAARLELLGALRPLLIEAHAAVATDLVEVSAGYRTTLFAEPDGAPTGEAVTPVDLEGGQLLDRDTVAAALHQRLAEVRARELERGVTLVGPHRDDLTLRLGTLPARGYASHGESWSLALALRLASYELLRADGGEPVLLLDDVFAELDTGRRDRLAELVSGAEQVLVTAAVPSDVPTRLSGRRFVVQAGTVTAATVTGEAVTGENVTAEAVTDAAVRTG